AADGATRWTGRGVRAREADPELQRASSRAPGDPDRRADPHRFPAHGAVLGPVPNAGLAAAQCLPGDLVRFRAGHRADRRPGRVPPAAVPPGGAAVDRRGRQHLGPRRAADAGADNRGRRLAGLRRGHFDGDGSRLRRRRPGLLPGPLGGGPVARPEPV
ncbi:MAG: hypothetical protein AVDCRST_MAG72-651, partial [uncultured Nocardioidaceae bacterium]